MSSEANKQSEPHPPWASHLATKPGKLEVDGDGPWKREGDQETYRGRGEADPAASQPLPDPREVAKRYRSNNRKPRETVYILCDCSSAIDIIVNRSALISSRLDIFHRLSILEDSFSALHIDILLVWIPGHHLIEFNETADLLTETFNGTIN